MTQDSTGTGSQFREVGNGCRTTDLSPSDVRGGRLQQLTDAAVAGLELELLQVPAALAQVRASHLQDKAFAAAVDPLAANRYISIGIRPVHCAALTITNCQFRFSLGAQGMTSGAAPTPPGTVFGMGVFAASDCAGLQLERNQFLCDRASRLDAAGAQHSLAGYRLTPTAVAPTADKNAFRQFNGNQVAALHDLVIRDNTFDEISATAVVLAEFGTIRTWDNTIRRSYVGIWLVEGRAAALTDLGAPFAVPGELKDQAGAVHAAFATGLLDPVRLLLTVFARTFPLPDLATMEVTTPAVEAADTEKLQAAGEQARQEWMTRFVKDVAAGLTPIRPSRRRTAKATGPDVSTAASADFNQGIGMKAALQHGSPIQQQLQIANADLTALARLIDTASQSTLTLRIERNDVECEPEQPTALGPATFIYVLPQNGVNISAEIVSNRISSTDATPAATRTRRRHHWQSLPSCTLRSPATSSLEPPCCRTDHFVPLDSWLPLNTIA